MSLQFAVFELWYLVFLIYMYVYIHSYTYPPTYMYISLSLCLSLSVSLSFCLSPLTHTLSLSLSHISTLVLSLMLSADGVSVTREAVDEMVAACDMGGPSPVNLETLFTKEPFCSITYFEGWVKAHPNLSSFTR